MLIEFGSSANAERPPALGTESIPSMEHAMKRLIGLLLASFFGVALFAADPPKPVPAKLDSKVDQTGDDPFAILVKKLGAGKVNFPESLRDTPLRTVKVQLEKQFEIRIIVREDLFKLEGEADGEILDRKLKIDSKIDGLPLGVALRLILADLNAVYLVQTDYIEITTRTGAVQHYDHPNTAKLAKGKLGAEPYNEFLRELVRDVPLVCAVVKDESLSTAAFALAEQYGFTVIVSKQAGEDANKKVSARIRNVPFETALEVLASEAGLTLVRRDQAYILTNSEHAAELKSHGAKATRK